MYLPIVVLVSLAFGWLVFRLAETIPGLWKTSERFNNTNDWIPGPERDAPLKWSTTNLAELGRRFIDWDAIQNLRPPKAGVLGTSGLLRFVLTSGREYQVGFLGPLFSDEGMRQEGRLSAYLREITPRFASRAPEARAA
jgi:hypothetical protein